MTIAEDFAATRPPVSACPARVLVPAAARIAALRTDRAGQIILSLPNAGDAQSISTVEAAVQAVPGVISAHVNLTQKRVSVKGDPCCHCRPADRHPRRSAARGARACPRPSLLHRDRP